jgi:hypothetical protein
MTLDKSKCYLWKSQVLMGLTTTIGISTDFHAIDVQQRVTVK